ncbi:ABC transporter permease [Pseudolysinimonas yzui]|uniref:Uncharacterized protein n=1 Tax=Pseudolysinimonas yzui TaxID=2708254 RepID=A0A8J3GNC8_9MICO|nr:ABC transporter permease [Pseudolysinimonas yzui]GHF06889.1 hypothetical protein GCM10011600_04410 [Pseudolysinimonas yzui]
MSAVSTPTIPGPRPLARRIGNVVRLHLANPFTIIGTPVIVLGLIFAVNWMIWWIVRTAAPSDPQSVADVADGLQYSGATLWIFVYMMVVAIMAMNLTFSFALGFGSTRRDFLLGSGLTFVGLAAIYAVAYILLAALETWTGGWGVGGTMFNSFYFGVDSPWWLRLFHVFALFLFFLAAGSAFGSMYVRWKARGLIVFFSVVSILIMGAVALVTVSDSWPAVGEFFEVAGFTGSYALSLVLSAIAGAAAYLILRRATPRN